MKTSDAYPRNVIGLEQNGEVKGVIVLSAPPPATCATCVHRGEVTGACLLDVLDPAGEELPDEPIKNWRNRESFSCGAWESAAPPRAKETP